VGPKLFKEAHGRGGRGGWQDPMYQKPGMSRRCKDRFIIQMSRWWTRDFFAWSVALVWVAGWGKMEDEEMEAWPGLFNLGVCNGQSTRNKDKINNWNQWLPSWPLSWCLCWCLWECIWV